MEKEQVKRMYKCVGWWLMGYPSDLPGWKKIYMLGAKLTDKGDE